MAVAAIEDACGVTPRGIPGTQLSNYKEINVALQILVEEGFVGCACIYRLLMTSMASRVHRTISGWAAACWWVSTGIDAGLLATERPSVCTISITMATESPGISDGSVTVSVETPGA